MILVNLSVNRLQIALKTDEAAINMRTNILRFLLTLYLMDIISFIKMSSSLHKNHFLPA